MPDRSEKLLGLAEDADEYELPYLSKSRVKSWLENPEHFRLKYLEGIKEPETKAMRRGTNIHETFEYFYNKVNDHGGFPAGGPTGDYLPPDHRKWADFIDPYYKNFIKWERSRWEYADGNAEDYLPISVEEEHWRDCPVGENAPEMMGLADAILPAAGVPSIEADGGVVIVDFKTGKVPDEQYRSPGIHTDLEYYTLLFEDKYDVAGALGYYPRENVIVEEAADERDEILNALEDVVRACNNYEGDQTFEANPGPLCGWSPDGDDRSPFYGLCSSCHWNVPIDNKEEFKKLLSRGLGNREIAEHLGCSTNAVGYWRYKLNNAQ